MNGRTDSVRRQALIGQFKLITIAHGHIEKLLDPYPRK